MSRIAKVNQFTGTLPVAGGSGYRILEPNDQRLGLVLYNQGAGTVFVGTDNIGSKRFPLPTGAALNFLTFGAPTNAVYAWGAAGHDLCIFEVIGPSVEGP